MVNVRRPFLRSSIMHVVCQFLVLVNTAVAFDGEGVGKELDSRRQLARALFAYVPETVLQTGRRAGVRGSHARRAPGSPRLSASLGDSSLFPRRIPLGVQRGGSAVPLNAKNGSVAVSAKIEKKSDDKLWTVAAFAFLAGVTDTAVSSRYNFFTCRMTGHAANLARTLTPGGPAATDFFFAAGMVGNFMLGSAIYRFLDLKLKKRSAKSVLAPVIFTLLTLHEVCSVRALNQWLTFFLLPLAMGMVTAISTAVTGAVTFVMSGHLLKIGSTVAEYFATGLNAAQKSAGRKSLVALSNFVLGAGASCLAPSCPTPFFPTLGAAYAVLLLVYANMYEKAGKPEKA